MPKDSKPTKTVMESNKEKSDIKLTSDALMAIDLVAIELLNISKMLSFISVDNYDKRQKDWLILRIKHLQSMLTSLLVILKD